MVPGLGLAVPPFLPLLPQGKVCGVGDGEKQVACERCRFALVRGQGS